MINRKNHLHFLALGCLKPYYYKFAADFDAAGYTSFSISNYRDSVAHFGTWINRKGIAIGEIKEDVLIAFAEHCCECPGGRRKNDYHGGMWHELDDFYATCIN